MTIVTLPLYCGNCNHVIFLSIIGASSEMESKRVHSAFLAVHMHCDCDNYPIVIVSITHKVRCDFSLKCKRLPKSRHNKMRSILLFRSCNEINRLEIHTAQQSLLCFESNWSKKRILCCMRNMNMYKINGITYSRHFTVPNYTKSREVYYDDICAEQKCPEEQV